MTLTKLAADYLKKLVLYGAIAITAMMAIMLVPWPLKLLPQLILGAMFVHGLELQHEMVHQRHFGKRWGDAIGFLLGLPMFVEFTEYRLTHSHHHRAVGTSEDDEAPPTYESGELHALGSFILDLLLVDHYRSILQNAIGSVLGNTQTIRHGIGSSGKTAPPMTIHLIMRGYQVMVLVLLGAIAFSVVVQTDMFLQLWLIPFLFAGPIHALVELPEHWGCSTISTDIMVNTRTIVPNQFADWFTNGNCWHVEHHYKPAMPMADLPTLHRTLQPQIQCLNIGYITFYQEFFRTLLRR
ncbi:MAG: fatty acid desaturase [Cyanobacteria bacterium P01_F01_bin.86]